MSSKEPKALQNVYIEFDENGNIVAKKRQIDYSNEIDNMLSNDPKYGPFECTICYKTFVKKCYWKRHVVGHNEKVSCKICGKEFSHNIHLNQHMLLHDEKRYECDICGLKMHFKFNLAPHRKTHIQYKDANGNVKYLS